MTDPVRDHFFFMVGSACENARVAHLPVEAVTRDGRRCVGVPQPLTAEEADPGEEVDHTGFARELTIGDAAVALDSIVALRISLPEWKGDL